MPKEDYIPSILENEYGRLVDFTRRNKPREASAKPPTIKEISQNIRMTHVLEDDQTGHLIEL